MRVLQIIYVCFFAFIPLTIFASETNYPLQTVQNNLRDKASLQRGAQLYMNYCVGCHSLQFTRYSQLGEYLKIQDEEGNVLEKLIQKSLNFVTEKTTDNIVTSMPKQNAQQWFGVAPPDLSLVSRSRGKNWVYNYLKAFYVDESRPWGVNNAVFPDVGMPHVLLPLQGKQQAKFQKVHDQEKPIIQSLVLSEPGELDKKGYDKAITDLVNFLEYIGEPVKEKRTRIGVFVLLFLIVLTVFLYALKREYWKEVH